MTENGDDRSLRNRPLGNTSLLVSPLCFGCAPLGDMPETFGFSVAKDRAHETLKAALESPVNFLDTAASYGDGESERRICSPLKSPVERSRSAFVATTYPGGTPPSSRITSPMRFSASPSP